MIPFLDFVNFCVFQMSTRKISWFQVRSSKLTASFLIKSYEHSQLGSSEIYTTTKKFVTKSLRGKVVETALLRRSLLIECMQKFQSRAHVSLMQILRQLYTSMRARGELSVWVLLVGCWLDDWMGSDKKYNLISTFSNMSDENAPIPSMVSKDVYVFVIKSCDHLNFKNLKIQDIFPKGNRRKNLSQKSRLRPGRSY